MSEDSRNCRQNALECGRLSETAPSAEAKEHFAELSKIWMRVAVDIETGRALADLLNDIRAA
jgi:hypothetical protein